MKKYKIASIAGDGIGKEVVPESLKVLKEAAKNLYSLLRKNKNKGYKSIAVEKIQNFGVGQTINDRLTRSSKF